MLIKKSPEKACYVDTFTFLPCIECNVFFIVCIALCVVFCMSVVLFCVICVFVCCLTVVSLTKGNKPYALQLNNIKK
jgi:hypothetical protein